MMRRGGSWFFLTGIPSQYLDKRDEKFLAPDGTLAIQGGRRLGFKN
jgi:hypothetical protein